VASPPSSRKLFNHLFVELSVSVGAWIPRYALWLHLHDLGWDPESLSQSDAVAFCDGPLDRFLTDRGYRLSRRAHRRLRASLVKYDLHPLPHERLASSSWGD
jgi:hypothetical protein